MEQTPSPQVSTKKNKKKNKALRIIPWVGLVLFVITAAVIGYLYVNKNLTLTFGDSSTVIVTNVVCRDTIIGKYNEAMSYQMRGTGPEQTLDETGLSNLEKEVSTKAGYAQDPTCQTILFWIAIHHTDASKAQAALKALNSLHTEGKYVDSNLGNNAPLSTFKYTIDNLTADSQG